MRNPRLTAAMLERRFKIRKSAADEIIDELRGEGRGIGGTPAEDALSAVAGNC